MTWPWSRVTLGHPELVAEGSVSPGNALVSPALALLPSCTGCVGAPWEGRELPIPTLSRRLVPVALICRVVGETEAGGAGPGLIPAALQGPCGLRLAPQLRSSESCGAPSPREAEARGSRQLGTRVSQPPQTCPSQSHGTKRACCLCWQCPQPTGGNISLGVWSAAPAHWHRSPGTWHRVGAR